MGNRMHEGKALVDALARRFGARVIETHISWVIVCADRVYKLKKPLRTAFLDYSTPELRERFCKEEVRVNQAMAPSLYLGVVRITGSAAAPEIDGPGPVLDHAVSMRRFPDGALFSERMAADTLTATDVDAFAAMLAAVHSRSPRLQRGGGGQRAPTHRRALAALEGAGPLFSEAQAQHLRQWLDEGARMLLPAWRERRRGGHVRECHGDLHLANVLMLDGRPAAFDAVEFDPALRWIDVAEDAAFPAMDFAARGRPDLCWRFLNAWLDATGEHASAGVLRYALVYRALVRAQVERLRTEGAGPAAAYAAAALDWSRPAVPRLVITHGLPGSGKTFQSQALIEQQGAIRVRSDVERKRLFGMGALESSRARGVDIYSGPATEKTYARLFELAGQVLDAGFSAVIDAAFLRRSERDAARELARRRGVGFEILACEAPEATLRQRLASRKADASEADAFVLRRLAAAVEPLTPEERAAIQMDDHPRHASR
ncbi:AAA family ATPase [Variovorax dokdonensis]|uniref:AAA family ATPase n=1 Tax=Variovorax dokdonensis TaxID=344883 RepID=A0ABT7NAW3_9BURK|nr:bifunctional aminoglycoside phosphotransferase/ATP-binding protein [Variovorax dokdonensis]MDM0045079.1 AAA family ATPase [Variovorax dokdonensis]